MEPLTPEQETMFFTNQGLVHKLLNKFITKFPRAKPYEDDLENEGQMGLLHAVRGFKEEMGNEFSTYACNCIYGYLQTGFKKLSGMKRIQENGQQRLVSAPVVLSEVAVNDEGHDVADLIVDGSVPASEHVDVDDLYRTFRRYLPQGRHRSIFHKYYRRGWSQVRIAKKYKMCKQRVHQILNDITQILRDVQRQPQNRSSKKLYEFAGEKHTLLEWSRKLNIPFPLLWQRIHRSQWPLHKALRTPPRGREIIVEYQGQKHRLADLARQYGHSCKMLRHRIFSLHWPVEKALTTPVFQKATITYRGETKTVSEWAKIIGVRPSVLRHRLRRNWPLERAMQRKPPHQRHVELVGVQSVSHT